MDIKTMTDEELESAFSIAGQRLFDGLRALVAAGRGEETHFEIREKTDPLSLEIEAAAKEADELRRERKLRAERRRRYGGLRLIK